MKRNWDTIREILSRLEAMDRSDAVLQLSDFPSERASEISYHMELLIEARLVDGDMSKRLGPGPSDFFVRRLTWSGHEFLDVIRSDTVWAKTKRIFAAKGAEMTFDLIKSVASEITIALVRGAAGI